MTDYRPAEALIDADGSVFPSELCGYAAGLAAVDLQKHWDSCNPRLDAPTKAGDVQDVINVLVRWREQLLKTDAAVAHCARCGVTYPAAGTDHGLTCAFWTVEAIAARIQAEVTEDIRRGRQPATVANFGELHDHADANCYGNLCDGDCPLLPCHDDDARSQHNAAILNAAQDAVDTWLITRAREREQMLSEESNSARKDRWLDIVSRALSVIVESEGADEHGELITELRGLVVELED